jgi:hypothetical protein
MNSVKYLDVNYLQKRHPGKALKISVPIKCIKNLENVKAFRFLSLYAIIRILLRFLYEKHLFRVNLLKCFLR